MELGEIKMSKSYSVIRGNTDLPWYLKYKKCIFGILAVTCICIIIAIISIKVGCINCDKTPSSSEEDYSSDLEDLIWDVSSFQEISQCPSSSQSNPPLVLVSLDGFRGDYLSRGLSPTLQKMSEFGVKADFMYSVYPSRTFPSHYSIVTGLYPSSHGVIDNLMYDDNLGAFFKPGKLPFNNSEWWQKEPIWVTAKKQGKYTATFFWPGSDVKINGSYPDVHVKFNMSIPFETRVDQVIEWLSRPRPPDFITLYMEEPDIAGHKYGPESQQVNQAIKRVDRMLNRLLYGLQKNNLTNCVNFIVTSDHGMAGLNCNRLIDIRKYVNATTVRSVIGSFGRLKPLENLTSVDEMISKFKCEEKHMRVYRKENLPIRMHYVDNSRIEPVILDIDPGYYIIDQDFNKSYCDGGKHGYDYLFPKMRAIFLAYGPSFKKNITIRPFQNIEQYELMSELIGIEPQPNNGTKGSLHEILINPRKLSPQVSVPSPPVADLPEDKQEAQSRIEASKCPCYVEPETDLDSGVIENRVKLHLPFGIPVASDDNNSLVLLHNADYIVGYDAFSNIPRWTGFTIIKTINTTEALVCWSGDARVENAVCFLAPDRMIHRPLYPPQFSSPSNQRQAFLMTNAVLKSSYHTSVLEREINKVIKKRTDFGPVNILTGPVFDPQIKTEEMDLNGTLIPTHIFTVLTWCTYDVSNLSECDARYLDVIAFILPNFSYPDNCETGEAVAKKNVAQVTDVERICGLKLYTELNIYEAIRLRTSMSHHIL